MLHIDRTSRATDLELTRIYIPTATAIVHEPSLPFKILVGESAKHSGLVLPGGKIDLTDGLSSNLEQAAHACIARELEEEVHAPPLTLRLIAITHGQTRDSRIIRAGSLLGTLVEDLVRSIDPEVPIEGLYGNPDYLFDVEVRSEAVRATEELRHLQWIDCRELSGIPLGAGHAALIELYRQSVEASEASRETFSMFSPP